MAKTKATIYNVAMRANVSLATVSRTLNNPEKVKKETIDRIRKGNIESHKDDETKRFEKWLVKKNITIPLDINI